VGHKLLPTFATATGELASIPDANDANRRHCGMLSQLSMIGRVTPAAGVPLMTLRPTAVASVMGKKRKYPPRAAICTSLYGRHGRYNCDA
jgi:hypothetical protein